MREGMEARAIAKYVKVSPRKARQVAELVKGKPVEEALNILHFSPKKASRPIEKAIRSAMHNLLQQRAEGGKDVSDLVVEQVRVDEGPTRKWYIPRAMGRATRIRRRSSHITVVVTEQREV